MISKIWIKTAVAIQKLLCSSTIIIVSSLGFFSVFSQIIFDKPITVDAAPQYSWKRANYQGMGFVTGLYFHPLQKDLIYARTDVGGAYRWAAATQSWISISDTFTPADISANSLESMAFDPSNPNVVYISTGSYTGSDQTKVDGKLWKSTNKGDTWSQLINFKDSSGKTIQANGNHPEYRGGGERLSIDPNNSQIMYYGSRNNGLLKTLNGGSTWSTVVTGANLRNEKGVAFVTFDKSSPVGAVSQTIYLGVPDDGIYSSTNAGVTWSKLNGLTSAGYPYRSQVVNGVLYVSYTEKDASTGGLWKYQSNQSAGGWSQISPIVGKAVTGFAVLESNPSVIYAEAYDINDYATNYDTSTFQSSNGGQNWSKINRSWTFPSWYDNRQPTNNQYDPTQAIGTSNFFFSSLNIDPFDSKKVWFATGWGVFGTNDVTAQKSQWTTIMKGFEELVVNQVVKIPGGKFLAPSWDMGMIVSNDTDLLPQMQIGNSSYINHFTSVDYAPSNKNIIAAVGSDQNFGSIIGQAVRSVDGGNTWKNITVPAGAFNGNISISATNPNNMVWFARIGSGDGSWNGTAFYTDDGGVSWTDIASIPRGNLLQIYSSQGLMLAADRINPNTFYAYQCSPSTGWQNIFYKSTDGGRSFAQTTVNPAGVSCAGESSLKVNPTTTGQLWYNPINVDVADQKLFVSPDGGANWNAISGIDGVHRFGFGKAASGQTNATMYAAGKVNGVYGMYFSTTVTASPNTPNWQIMSNNIGFDNVNSIDGDMDVFGKVYVGNGGKGVFVGQVSINQSCTNGSTNSPACPNIAPTVSIISPTYRQKFNLPTSVTISIKASDTDGTVNLVEVFNSGIKIGNATKSSGNDWSFVWTNPPAGNVILTAKAFDNRSLASTSQPVLITLFPTTPDTTPPKISINDPYSCGSMIFGKVSDTSGVSTVKVTLTQQSSTINTKTFSVAPRNDNSYNIPIQSGNATGGFYVPAGVYTVSYLAVDSFGNSSIPKSFTANIQNRVNCNPNPSKMATFGS